MPIPPLPAPPVAPTSATGPAAIATSGGFPINVADSPDALGEAERTLLIAHFRGVRKIEATREEQLNLLLAVAGRKMFPAVSPKTSPQTLRASITESGRLPGVGGKPGPDFFLIGAGRIELHDDHAFFRPNGSWDVIRVSASGDGAGVPVPVGGNNVNASSTVNVTTIGPGGMKMTTTTTVGAMPTPFAGINPIAAGVTMVEAVLSAGVAIFLMVIGILVLRDSPRGAMLHWIYVWIKIPLVLIAAGAGAWMMLGFFSSIAAMPGTAPPPGSFASVITFMAVVGGLLALAYPVSLIFVLRSRRVREYYNTIRP
jgi:hypothetical protein